jgi:hypothetical protein
MNVQDMVASAANESGHGAKAERLGAVQTLAHYTRHCPNLAAATVPYLSAALSDPDPSVKGAAAISLGALGPHAAAALPALRAAKGSSVAYFDYLLGEATASIRDREPLPVDEGCGPFSPETFENRRRLLVGKPRPDPVWRPRQGS